MIQDETRGRGRYGAILSGVALAALMAGGAQAADRHAVRISAGPLDAALRRLAAETHEQLLYAPDLVAGRRAPAINGDLTTEQALAQLLADSELTATRTGPTVLVLGRARPAVTPARLTTAPEVAGARPFGAEASADPTGASGDPASLTGGSGAPPPPATVSEVEVTGTHIRGVTDSPSPVQVITRADFERSGYQTVAEALQVLPQNFAGAGSEAASALSTDRASGNSFYATGLNLRGLGPNATLTLINGHRLAGTGLNGDFADLSTLPSSAVERVEVLLDGASALYGSDAVGGVVNVIMRRRWTGAETKVSAGTATAGSPSEAMISQSFGRAWTGGGLTLALEHSRRGALLARDRDFSASADLRSQGGTDHRLLFSHPGNILRVDPATGLSTPYWAIPTGQSGVGLTAGQFVANTQNLQEPLAESALLPHQVADSAYVSLVQALGDRLELSSDVTFGRRRYQLPTGTVFSSFTVSRANPFYVSPVGAASQTIQYAFEDDLPPAQLKGASANLATTLGADLKLSGDWRLAAYGALARDHTRTAQTGLLNATALAEALGNAADNPATPYSAARDGYFNPFGDRAVNTATVTGFIGSGFSTSDTRDRVESFDLKLDGTLFTLPAGPLRAALGASARKEQYDRSSRNFTSGVAPTATTPLAFGRDVRSAFAELRAPLAGPESKLGALDLSLAGRIEDYSDFGTTKNPKVGLIWTPKPDLHLRASYGTSFRAPSLPQLFGLQVYGFNRLPKGTAGNVQIVLLQGGNPTLTPETATSWSLGFDSALQALPGLRLSLSWFDTRFTNRIEQPVRQALGTALSDPAYAAFVQFVSPATDPADRARVQALIDAPQASGLAAFPATTYGAIVDARYVNTGSLHVAGLDAQIGYSITHGATHFDLAANGAYLERYDQGITPTSVPVSRLNTANFPVRFRGRATAAATRGALNGQLALNYVGAYQSPLGPRIDAQLTADAQVRISGQDQGRFAGLSARLSVRNLFDAKPPFYDSPANVAYDPANADPIGRFVTLQLTKAW